MNKRFKLKKTDPIPSTNLSRVSSMTSIRGNETPIQTETNVGQNFDFPENETISESQFEKIFYFKF